MAVVDGRASWRRRSTREELEALPDGPLKGLLMLPLPPRSRFRTLSPAEMEMLGQIEQEFVALPDLAAWIRRLQDHLREARMERDA